MPARDGKGYGGDHTTLIDLAAEACDLAHKLSGVKKISPGVILVGKAKAGGSRRVRFSDMQGGFLLTVRQAHSVQEVRVYADNVQEVRLALCRSLRNNGIPISFRT